MNAWRETLEKRWLSVRSYRQTRMSPALRTVLLCLVIGLACAQALGSYLAFRTSVPSAAEAAVPEKARTVEQWQAANERLAKKIAAQAPKEPYLVVDTANNRVTLRQGDTILRDMLASCGSGSVLEDPASGRRWVFDTPRGQHRIKSKVTNPLWIKPDWAFLEEGKPVPTNSAERAEPGVMGDYALGIGNGYFIHGTLYKRMLGRNVSHGCVRLGAEDLAHVYREVPIGTRVFIF